MIIARQAWRLLRTARTTLQLWKQLPPERQREVQGSMQRVGPLVVELSNSLRQRNVHSSRPLLRIMTELGAALNDVRGAAPELTPDFGPRTRRGRLAMRAARGVGSVAAKKASGVLAARALPEETGLDEPGTEAELDAVAAAFADIAADPARRQFQFDAAPTRE